MDSPDLLHPDELQRLIDSANRSAVRGNDGNYRISLVRRDGYIVLAIAGRVLQPIPDEFERRLSGIIDLHDFPRMAIDLSACDYVSSAVMGFMIALFKAGESRSGMTVLIGPNQRILRMLALVGLDRFFLTLEDEAVARDYFAELDRQRPGSGPRVRRPGSDAGHPPLRPGPG